jgi:L-threonylcarbamoyladenylate synthase
VSDPVEDAAGAALAGRLIVIPTDTVYGIGTRPDDPAATAALFDAKGRPRDLAIAVLVPSRASAGEIAAFDPRADALAGRFWPGPLTLVLPRKDASLRWDLGTDARTIGVRVPHHPMALAVLSRTGPLAVSSANRTGEPTPSDCDGLAGGPRAGPWPGRPPPAPPWPCTCARTKRWWEPPRR